MVSLQQTWLWALISCGFAFLGVLVNGDVTRALDQSAGVIWLALTLTFIGKRG